MKVMKKFLSVILVFVIMLCAMPKYTIEAKASENSILSDDAVDLFVDLFYSTNSDIADDIRGILKGEKSGDLDKYKDLYNKIYRFLGVFENVSTDTYNEFISRNATLALTDSLFVAKIVKSCLDIYENGRSFAESTNAMQKAIDALQVFENGMKLFDCGQYFPSQLSLILNATEVGLTLAGYLELSYFKEAYTIYEYELSLAYYSNSELPISDYKITIGSQITQEEANDLFAKLYTKYYLMQMLDRLPKISGGSSNETTPEYFEKISLAFKEHTLFSNFSIINPATAYSSNSNNISVTYESSNTNIATVDSAGKITPVSYGTVTITASTPNGTSDSCTITVLPFYANKTNNEYTITDYIGNGRDVTIPSYVNGCPVVAIGNKAFYDCSSLTSITIPDGVTSIGDYAFDGCSSLTSVTIPDSVTSIGDYAFYFCSSLTSVNIPDSVTSIGVGAFNLCSSLTSIEVSVSNCNYSSQDGVLFNKNKTTLVCYPAGKASTSYVIPNGVTCIDDLAFGLCSRLTSIIIPDSVTSIGLGAFYKCESLTSITIPDGVTIIGDSAFYICTSLTSIIIPDSVTTIDGYAFFGCASLTSIIIPDSVTSIGGSAFSSCTSLTSITIPDSVTSIGDYAFSSCSSLTSVTIPDSVTSIGDDTFCWCDSLTSITIPDSVTSIGGSAFYKCESLTSITIPDSVTSIGGSAFSRCTSLTSIIIPNSVTFIGDYAFNKCNSLTDVYYLGTKAGWGNMSINSNNAPLTNANIHYYSPGDVDFDGNMNLNDLVDLAQYLAGWDINIIYPEALDLNGDGKTDLEDLTHFARYTAGWDVTLNEVQ